MQPKHRVIDFVKSTQLNESYTFTISGSDADADAYVHRMRVALSKMRNYVKCRGRVPRHFKMLLESQEYDATKNKTTIVLIKALSRSDVSNEVDSIFSDLAGGESIG